MVESKQSWPETAMQTEKPQKDEPTTAEERYPDAFTTDFSDPSYTASMLEASQMGLRPNDQIFEDTKFQRRGSKRGLHPQFGE